MVPETGGSRAPLHHLFLLRLQQPAAQEAVAAPPVRPIPKPSPEALSQNLSAHPKPNPETLFRNSNSNPEPETRRLTVYHLNEALKKMRKIEARDKARESESEGVLY